MNYYYLIASLPELDIENEGNNALDINEIIDMIHRNLTDEDLVIFQALLYQNDNRNLLNVIFKEYHDLAVRHHNSPSVFPRDIIEGYRRNIPLLPDYMIDFLQDNAGIFSTFSLADIELKLRSYFMNFIEKLDSEFLLQYYQWQYDLEKIVAEMNERKYDFLNAPKYDATYSDMVPVMVHSLDKKQVYSDLQPLMNTHQYIEMERKIDAYYWAFADSWFDVFTVNAALSYTVKLLRTAMWSSVPKEEEAIKEAFFPLLNDLKKLDRSPKMPVV